MQDLSTAQPDAEDPRRQMSQNPEAPEHLPNSQPPFCEESEYSILSTVGTSNLKILPDLNFSVWDKTKIAIEKVFYGKELIIGDPGETDISAFY